MRTPLLSLLLLLLSSTAQASAQDARALFEQGRGLLEEGDERGAKAAFLRSTEAAPTWLLPWLELGELAARRREDVARVREALLELGPSGASNPRYHRILGELAALEGEEDAAVAAWQRSLSLLARQEELRLRMAAALDRLERHEEAAQAYARLLRSDPSDLVIRARYAHALEAAGEALSAREQLETLIKLQPGQELPLRRLARFFERQGEIAAARRLHAEADRLGERGAPRKMRPLPPSKY